MLPPSFSSPCLTSGKLISINNNRIRQQLRSKGHPPPLPPRQATDEAARAPQHAIGHVLEINGFEQLVHTFESEVGADAGVTSKHGVEGQVLPDGLSGNEKIILVHKPR